MPIIFITQRKSFQFLTYHLMSTGRYTNGLMNLCCYKSGCLKKKFPIEGYVGIFGAILVVILEIVTGKLKCDNYVKWLWYYLIVSSISA